jgi:hypothetical protein
MLIFDDRLAPNSAEVAASVLDGEAIMINLSSGVYYSMDGVGGLIWELIAQRQRLEEIVAAIVQAYDVPADRAKTDLERLAGELLGEQLVCVVDGVAPASPPTPAPTEPAHKLCYEAPRLQTYRDMEDLLALDPPLPRLEDLHWSASSEPASR